MNRKFAFRQASFLHYAGESEKTVPKPLSERSSEE
ncbi:hypothetical protein Pgin03_00884 [Porphyromonas gingivalis]